MKNSIKFRKFLWKFGYDLVRFGPMLHPIARKKRLFEFLDNDLVVDVGANVGQFAESLRVQLDYRKDIISFEPLSSAYHSLEKNIELDNRWSAHNFALGDEDCELEINISKNSFSSSFLDMLPIHLKSAPQAEYVDKEVVKVKKLDSIYNEYFGRYKSIYLKIDAQGFEQKIISGAKGSLKYIQAIQMEMSLRELYKGELAMEDMIVLMRDHGFKLVSLEPGLSDWKTGVLLQADGVFQRVT